MLFLGHSSFHVFFDRSTYSRPPISHRLNIGLVLLLNANVINSQLTLILKVLANEPVGQIDHGCHTPSIPPLDTVRTVVSVTPITVSK